MYIIHVYNIYKCSSSMYIIQISMIFHDKKHISKPVSFPSPLRSPLGCKPAKDNSPNDPPHQQKKKQSTHQPSRNSTELWGHQHFIAF